MEESVHRTLTDSDTTSVDFQSTPRPSSYEASYATPSQEKPTPYVTDHVPRPPSTIDHVPRPPSTVPDSRNASLFRGSVMRRNILGRPGSSIYGPRMDGTTKPFSPRFPLETTRMGLGGNTDFLVDFYESKFKAKTSETDIVQKSPGSSITTSPRRISLLAGSPRYINGDRQSGSPSKVDSIVTTPGGRNVDRDKDDDIDVVDGEFSDRSTEPPTIHDTDEEGEDIPGIVCNLEVVGSKLPLEVEVPGNSEYNAKSLAIAAVDTAKPTSVNEVTPDDGSSRLDDLRSASEEELLQLDEMLEQHIDYARDFRSDANSGRRRMLGANVIGFIASQSNGFQQTTVIDESDAHVPKSEKRGRKKTKTERGSDAVKSRRRSNGRGLSDFNHGKDRAVNDDIAQRQGLKTEHGSSQKGPKKTYSRTEVQTGLDKSVLPPVVADNKMRRIADMNVAAQKNIEARRQGGGTLDEHGEKRNVGDGLKAAPSFHKKLRDVDGRKDGRLTPSSSGYGDSETGDHSSTPHVPPISSGKQNKNRAVREGSTGKIAENETRRKKSHKVVMRVDNHDYIRKPHPPRSSISPVPECLPAIPKSFLTTTKTPNARGVDLKELPPVDGGKRIGSARRIGSAVRNVQKDKIDVSDVSALLKRHKK